MSKCTQVVDGAVMDCHEVLDEAKSGCVSWADEGSKKCGTWADEGSKKCGTWADEGSKECGTWADEGSKHCCTWWPCSWFCKAWYWVAKWVCKAWYWVAKWVCKAWYWVAKWVCKAWYWVAKWVCKIFLWILKAVCTIVGWIFRTVCTAWNGIVCTFKAGGKSSMPRKIEKVFVLMLENRSYDHLLGFAALTGIDPAGQPTRADDFAGKDLTQPPFVNLTRGGVAVSPTPTAVFKIADEDKDPPHEFIDILLQMTGSTAWDNNTVHPYPAPQNNGFVFNYEDAGSAHPANVMNCFDPANVPIITTLAREFAVCDAWFASLPGPTWPNRFFVHAASSGGLDDSPSGLESAAAELIDGFSFQHGTVFDALDSNCVDWRVFEGDELPQCFALKGMTLAALGGCFTDMDEFAEEVNKADFEPSYIFIEPSYGNILPTTAGDYTCGTSQHPLDDVTRGERLIKAVYETIRNSPHWERSALIITYDEHGGFFDHVKPPTAPAPGDKLAAASNNHHNFDFKQLGVRVPAVIVSPWVNRGVIDHTVYDHSSLVRSLGLLFKFSPLTRRDGMAKDFLHLFNRSAPRTDAPTTLPEVPDSGFECTRAALTWALDNGLPEAREPETGESSSPLTGAPGAPPSTHHGDPPLTHGGARPPVIGEGRPVPASFWGFMHVAYRKATSYGPGRLKARRELTPQYRAVRTEADARRFIHEARLRVRKLTRPGRPFEPLTLHGGPPPQTPAPKPKPPTRRPPKTQG
jgi:phospholipase C